MDPNPGSTLFRCFFLVGVSTPGKQPGHWPLCPHPTLSHKTPFLCPYNFSEESLDLWRKAGAPQLGDKKRKVGPHPQLGTSHRGLPCYSGSDEAEVILCQRVWVTSFRTPQKVLAKLMAFLTILLNRQIPCLSAYSVPHSGYFPVFEENTLVGKPMTIT